jgi:hypothetical protein
MKGRTRCGVTLRNVGIESLRGPAFRIQYADWETPYRLTDYKKLSTVNREGREGGSIESGRRRTADGQHRGPQPPPDPPRSRNTMKTAANRINGSQSPDMGTPH